MLWNKSDRTVTRERKCRPQSLAYKECSVGKAPRLPRRQFLVGFVVCVRSMRPLFLSALSNRVAEPLRFVAQLSLQSVASMVAVRIASLGAVPLAGCSARCHFGSSHFGLGRQANTPSPTSPGAPRAGSSARCHFGSSRFGLGCQANTPSPASPVAILARAILAQGTKHIERCATRRRGGWGSGPTRLSAPLSATVRSVRPGREGGKTPRPGSPELHGPLPLLAQGSLPGGEGPAGGDWRRLPPSRGGGEGGPGGRGSESSKLGVFRT